MLFSEAYPEIVWGGSFIMDKVRWMKAPKNKRKKKYGRK